MRSFGTANRCFAVVLPAGCILLALAQSLWGQGSSGATPDSQSVIYIFREYKLNGNEAVPNVVLDGRSISQLYNGTYLKLTIHPGKHTLTATVGRHTASVDLDAAVGETYYLQVSPKFSHLELASVSRAEAEPAIAKGKAIVPVEPEAAERYNKAQLKEENEKLEAAANQPASSPPPPGHDSAASAAPVAGAPASAASAPTNAASGAGTDAAPSSDLETRSPASGTGSLGLTDEQIRTAAQRGIDNEDPGGLALRKTEWIRESGGISLKLFILSDSDRIGLAADQASHDITKVDRQGYALKRQKKAGFALSIADARSTAVLFGVVTVIVEITGLAPSKVAEWAGSGYHIALEADGKTIEPLTDAEYQERAARAGAVVKPVPPWSYKAFTSFEGCATIDCIYEQIVFPVVEGSQKLTVVVTNAGGHRKEKQINPKLFAEQ